MINLLFKSLFDPFFLTRRAMGDWLFFKHRAIVSNANCIVQSFCLTKPLHKRNVWDGFSLFMRTKIDIFGR